MKLNQLRDFIAVAESGSLRGGSRALGLAQPAMTRSIQQLERQLGALLFERRKRGMVLTQTGELFLRRARSVVAELHRARDEVQQFHGGVEGTVVICLSTVPHVALLPGALSAFRLRFPQVRLDVIESAVYVDVESKLRDGSIDFFIGIVGTKPPAAGLVAETLFENSRAVLARIGHPLSKAKTLADLVDAEWVSAGAASEPELATIFQRHGLAAPRFGAMGTSALSLLVLIAYSDMIALLPRDWISFPPVAALLQKIEIKESIPAPPVMLIRRADMPLTPAAEYLCDLFKAGVPRLRHHDTKPSRPSAPRGARAPGKVSAPRLGKRTGTAR